MGVAGDGARIFRAAAGKVDVEEVRIAAPAAAAGVAAAATAFKRWNDERRGDRGTRSLKDVFSEAKAEQALATLPSDPVKRTIIAVVNSKHDARTEGDGPLIARLKVPDRAPTSGLVRQLAESGLLVPGAVLIQSPMRKDRYYPLESAAAQIALEKLMLLDQVASLLGVTSFEVESAEVRQAGKRLTVNADGSLPSVGKLAGSGGADTSQSLRSIVAISSKTSPRPLDIAAAEELVEKYHLGQDVFVQALLDNARNGAFKSELNVDVSVSREAARAVEAGVKVQAGLKDAPKFGGKAKASVVTDVQTKLRLVFA